MVSSRSVAQTLDLADVPTLSRLTVAALEAQATVERMTALAAQIAPPLTPAQERAALLAPWDGWIAGPGTARTRQTRASELLAFLRWAQAHYLALPSEVTESMAAHYALWLEQRALAPSTVKRRFYAVRAALRWHQHHTAQEA